VSNIAKHFERISRDNERATRRYAVIRGGRKPRPVASARAKVEILDSVRDAVKDEESESSSESSEADDEGEGDDDTPVPAPKKNDSMNSTTSRPETEPEVAPVTESPVEMEADEVPPSSVLYRNQLESLSLGHYALSMRPLNLHSLPLPRPQRCSPVNFLPPPAHIPRMPLPIRKRVPVKGTLSSER
jgi:hypothetical protein